MDLYRVEVSRRGLKAWVALPRREQQRIRAAIDLLSDQPRPPGCVALSGEANAYRVRVGGYRIVYDVLDDRLIIQVIRIARRRDVYRK